MAQLLAELRGAAEAAEVPLQALCSLSLQYEATTLVVYREDLLYKWPETLIYTDDMMSTFMMFMMFLMFISDANDVKVQVCGYFGLP